MWIFYLILTVYFYCCQFIWIQQQDKLMIQKWRIVGAGTDKDKDAHLTSTCVHASRLWPERIGMCRICSTSECHITSVCGRHPGPGQHHQSTMFWAFWLLKVVIANVAWNIINWTRIWISFILKSLFLNWAQSSFKNSLACVRKCRNCEVTNWDFCIAVVR